MVTLALAFALLASSPPVGAHESHTFPDEFDDESVDEQPEDEFAPVSRASRTDSHRTVVVLVDAMGLSDAEMPFTRADVVNRVFSADSFFNRYFAEVSDGQFAGFDGGITDVHGWHSAVVGSAEDPCRSTLGDAQFHQLLVQHDIPVHEYDHVFALVSCDRMAGYATVGQGAITINGERCECTSGYVAMPPARWDELTVAAAGLVNQTIELSRFEYMVGHELAHNFGAGHDGYYNCGDQSWGSSDECVANTYGNDMSLLGLGVGRAWGISAPARYDSGWLDEDDGALLVVDAPGTYAIGALALKDQLPRAAAIVNPETGAFDHFVEFRLPAGFDQNLADGPGGSEAVITHRRGLFADPRYLVIDGQPVDDNPTDRWPDSAVVGFLPGSSFTTEEGATITIDAIDTTNRRLTFTVSGIEGPAEPEPVAEPSVDGPGGSEPGRPPGTEGAAADAQVIPAVTCLGGNGRIDVNIVNGPEAATYSVRVGTLSPRVRRVAADDWWRNPITGRPDGSVSVEVKRNGETFWDGRVLVVCDGALRVTTGSEITLLQACRGGNGFVAWQFANPTARPRSYVIQFEGVPGRSSTAAAYGASVRGVSGRPDGIYEASIHVGGVEVWSEPVTVACD